MRSAYDPYFVSKTSYLSRKQRRLNLLKII
jgi:hypothetical protein